MRRLLGPGNAHGRLQWWPQFGEGRFGAEGKQEQEHIKVDVAAICLYCGWRERSKEEPRSLICVLEERGSAEETFQKKSARICFRKEEGMVAAGDDGLGTLTHSSRAQTPGQKLQKLKTLDVGKLTRASDQQKRGFILRWGP